MADNGSESWLPESGDVLDETINRPLPGRGTAYDVVHFDLDSQNSKSGLPLQIYDLAAVFGLRAEISLHWKFRRE